MIISIDPAGLPYVLNIIHDLTLILLSVKKISKSNLNVPI